MRQLKSEKQQTSCDATLSNALAADTFEQKFRAPKRSDRPGMAEGFDTEVAIQSAGIPRKEVIQPHLPVRLPCYDFTPIIDPTLDACPCGLPRS
jgi:hypothetical protein